jgi:hypothetical protein
MSNDARGNKIEVLESLLGRIQKTAGPERPAALAFPEGDGTTDPSLLAYKKKLAQARSAVPAPVAARPKPIARVYVPAPAAAAPPPAAAQTPVAARPAPQVAKVTPAPIAAAARNVTPAPTPTRMATPTPAPTPAKIATPMPAQAALRPMNTPAAQQAARPMQTPMPQVAAKAVPRTKTLLMGRPMAAEPTPFAPPARQPVPTPLPALGEPLPMPPAPEMPVAPQVRGPHRSDSAPTMQATFEPPPEAIAARPVMHVADAPADLLQSEPPQVFEPIAPSRMVQISSPSPEPLPSPEERLPPAYDDAEVTRVGYGDEALPGMAEQLPSTPHSPAAAPIHDDDAMAPPPGIQPMEPGRPMYAAPMQSGAMQSPPMQSMPMQASPVEAAPAPYVPQPMPPQLVAKSAPPPVSKEGHGGWWLAAIVLILFAAGLLAAYHYNYLPLR